MNLLGIALGLVRLAQSLLGWLDRREVRKDAQARAARAALAETVELLRHAKQIDQDTANLSPDARKRVRDAIRRNTTDE